MEFYPNLQSVRHLREEVQALHWKDLWYQIGKNSDSEYFVPRFTDGTECVKSLIFSPARTTRAEARMTARNMLYGDEVT